MDKTSKLKSNKKYVFHENKSGNNGYGFHILLFGISFEALGVRISYSKHH